MTALPGTMTVCQEALEQTLHRIGKDYLILKLTSVYWGWKQMITIIIIIEAVYYAVLLDHSIYPFFCQCRPYLDFSISSFRRRNKKSSYGLDWLQKGIYGPAKLDNRQPQKVQDFRWIYKLYRENNENLERRIDSWRKSLGTIYQPLRSGRIWHKINF